MSWRSHGELRRRSLAQVVKGNVSAMNDGRVRNMFSGKGTTFQRRWLDGRVTGFAWLRWSDA